MSIFSKITLNTLISYAGRVVSSVFALVIIGLMTRALGPEKFGEYTTITAYLSMFVILADLGLQALMTREISRLKDGLTEIASSFFTLRLLSSAVFLLLGIAISLFFPYASAIKLGMIVAVSGLFFLSVNQLLLGVFQKHLAMHVTALAEIAGRGVQLLLVYLIYAFYRGNMGDGGGNGGIGLFLFLGAMSVSSLLIFILQFFFAQKYIKLNLTFNVKQWLDILKTAWPIALSIVLTLIYFKIDTIFLSLMKPQSDVGIYGVAYRVLESLIFFPAIFAGMLLPILSREAAASDLGEFRAIFRKAFKVITIFAIPTVLGGIILSYSIANLVGGKDFIISGAPLQALFIATGLIFFGNLFGRAIIALDLQKKAVCAYLFGVILNVALNFIFIPKYTYMGAAWTTVATEFMITVFLFWLIWQRAKVSLDIATILKSVLAAGVMAGVLLYLTSPIGEPVSFAKLGLLTILGGGIYFGALYIINSRNI